MDSGLNGYLDKTKAKLSGNGDVALAILIGGILFVLLFPVNVFFIDLLLAISITISVMILMSTLFIQKPLDLSVFPTILLITAVMRLSLNIASTRIILTDGHMGPSAAGHVIEAFGNFVMSGNIVIGLIVFAIITIINFVVITKGSGRIAEVAARFSLDAMPGKQMAIDADLSAGLISETEARNRRKILEDETTFYGSMDGANKFVRGDAIAGLLITFINLIGGIIIGMVQKNLSFESALQTYSLLTIGDGLVSQVPALLVSLSSGLIVSKSGVIGSADKAIFGQFSKFPQALLMASFVIAMMSFMPGIPAFHFLFVALITAGLGWMAKKIDANQEAEAEKDVEQNQDSTNISTNKEETISDSLHIDNIKIELGYNLLSLLHYQKGHKLTDQIKALRKQVAKELGFIMPSVRIIDNVQLSNNSYVIKIKDIECGKGEIQVEKYLVMNPRGDAIDIPGIETKEPAFGLSALWIDEQYREQAVFKNYTVVDPPTIITTHLTEIVKQNITDLLSYSETLKLIDELGEEHKKLVADTVPDKISVSGLQRVLQNLLIESVSIRDLPTILEAISESVAVTKNIMAITEFVRLRLSRQITHANCDEDGNIRILSLSQAWEKEFIDAIVITNNDDRQFGMEPSKIQQFLMQAKTKLEELALQGITPVIVASPNIRVFVKSVITRLDLSISVLSSSEIHFRAKVIVLGQI